MSTTIDLSKLHFKQPDPIEIAKLLQSELDRAKVTQQELAMLLGKKRSTIANYLRLLKLPSEIQSSLSKAEISMGHAKVLISLEREAQMALWQGILKRNLTVREAEKFGESVQCHQHAPVIQDLERALERKFGTKVKIKQTQGGRGEVIFDYYSFDDLDRILETWGVESGD